MGLDGFLAIMADPFQMLYAVLGFQIQVFSFFGHNVACLFQTLDRLPACSAFGAVRVGLNYIFFF